MRPTTLAWLLVAAALVRPAGAFAQVLVADLNGDGIHDRVHVGSRPTELVVHIANARHSRRLHAASPILRLAVADVDRDGHADIVASTSSSGLRVWINRGHGRFRAHRARAPSVQWHDVMSSSIRSAVPDNDPGLESSGGAKLSLTATRLTAARPTSRFIAASGGCVSFSTRMHRVVIPRGPPALIAL
jgi:hypothetical protein